MELIGKNVSMKALLLQTTTEISDASRYDPSTYSSCNEHNSKESDYGHDDDGEEETTRENSCSSSYYATNSKHESGSNS